MLTTTLAATNSSMETQSSFALLSPFDSFLIDVQAQERLSAIWSNAAPFRANKADFAAEFANNAAAKSAERLYALATTPDSVAFTASDGQNILVETSFEPFSLGQSLSHFSSTGNTSSIFFVATAPTGPLDDAWFVDRQKRILGLDPTVASALKTLGWTLCVDSKDACSNAAAAGGSSGPSLPPWLIAVIVLVGVGFMALAGFLIYRLFRRREQSKGSKPAAPLDAAPSNDSINAGPKLGPPVASSETVFLRPAPALPEGFQVVRADSMSGYITDSSAVSIHSSERASLARTSMQSFGLSGDQIAGATALGSSSFTGQQMDEYAMRSIPLGSWQHMRAASAPVSVLALQQSVVPMPGYIARPMPSPSASWGDRRRTPSSTPPTGPTDPSPPGSPGMIMANGSRSLPTEQWRRTRTGSTPRSIDPATPGLGVPAAEPWQRMRMSSTPRAIGGMAVAPGLPQSGPMDAAFRSLPVQERMHTAMVPMSRGLASTDTLPSRRNVTTIVLPPSAFQGSGSGTTPMVTPGGTRRKSRRPNGAGQPLGTPGPLPTPGQRMMMPGQGQATPSGMTPGMTPGTASIPTGTPLETPATLAEPKDYFAIPVERDPSGTV